MLVVLTTSIRKVVISTVLVVLIVFKVLQKTLSLSMLVVLQVFKKSSLVLVLIVFKILYKTSSLVYLQYYKYSESCHQYSTNSVQNFVQNIVISSTNTNAIQIFVQKLRSWLHFIQTKILTLGIDVIDESWSNQSSEYAQAFIFTLGTLTGAKNAKFYCHCNID